MNNQNPPHSIDAERSLLGAMLLARQAIYDVLEVGTKTSDFYAPRHQHIYEAMTTMHLADRPVDVVTLADWLNRAGLLGDDGLVYLQQLQMATPAVSSAKHYARIVTDTSMFREMILAAAEINAIAYSSPDDAGRALADAAAAVSQLITAADRRLLKGYYEDSALLDPGGERDEAQPWIARGVLRRHQRLLVVARAGIGKSTFLRQLAACCENGVHPYTGQPTETPRRTLIVELEAGEWDVASSLRTIDASLQRSLNTASVWDLRRPSLLHVPGGIDLRTAAGFAVLEAAIRRTEPELVAIGPLKYLSISKGGENYEIAALNLMGLLNGLLDRYDFALVMEAHFSRGDHGAPGGSERWVDWPDVGFGIHPPSDDITTRLPIGGKGTEMVIKQFRIPRDSDIWVPSAMIRGAEGNLPWHVPDYPDPYRYNSFIYSSRYGGLPAGTYQPNIQGEF